MITLTRNHLGELVLIEDLGRTVESVTLDPEFAAKVTASPNSDDPVWLASIWLSANVAPVLETERRLHVRAIH